MAAMRWMVMFVLAAGLTFGCGGSEEDDDGMSGTGRNAPDGGSAPQPDAGALAAYMEPCEPALEDACEDGLTCFQFNARGPHCTHDCAGDTDCAAPSAGCNNMGVCKAP